MSEPSRRREELGVQERRARRAADGVVDEERDIDVSPHGMDQVISPFTVAIPVPGNGKLTVSYNATTHVPTFVTVSVPV